jgi:hypothetical protein
MRNAADDSIRPNGAAVGAASKCDAVMPELGKRATGTHAAAGEIAESLGGEPLAVPDFLRPQHFDTDDGPQLGDDHADGKQAAKRFGQLGREPGHGSGLTDDLARTAV